ncbi:hypothetical protein [Photorhabdus akhurstii]|nr:hypothetical protein [Photorhabdus akhurstii]
MLLLALAIALVPIMLWLEARLVVRHYRAPLFLKPFEYTLVYTVTLNHGVYTLSMPNKRSPQFPMRLTEEFRLQLEVEMKKDGDTSLATWIKRILRKELLARGIEPKG